jgi:hypothetical protein
VETHRRLKKKQQEKDSMDDVYDESDEEIEKKTPKVCVLLLNLSHFRFRCLLLGGREEIDGKVQEGQEGEEA